MITELSTGFPGYDSIIGPENATIGTILRDNGYATSWFGKNHNTPGFQYSVAGPFDQWPSGMGFEYFYGFMGGETDQWTPYLFRDHTQIFPWIGKPDYNLTTDMADEAIGYMQQLNAAAPDQPFFVYYVPGGSHSPHQPTKEWIDKFKGKFDMGWNAMREQIFANQKRLGVIPANAQLTPWPDDLPKWETLSADEKKLFARQAEVFAGYTAYTDHEIGRVIQAVEDMGKLDNTLIIYICRRQRHEPRRHACSARPTSTPPTTASWMFPVAEQLKFYDAWGSAATYPHMAVAWAWAFDTPFKWTKQVASHFGGTRQGMAISWPARIKDAGGIRHQFHHVIDIVPTILEATGIKAPEMVDGIKQKPIEGVSMAYTFDKANANAPSTRKTQYFEMIANRGIYHDGWYANTTPPVAPWVLNAPMPDVNDYKWELYNLDRGLLAGQRSRGARCPTSSRKCRRCSCRRRPSTTCFPLDNSQFAAAHRAAAERHGGTDRLHLLGRDARHSARQRTRHPEQVVHDHRRGRGPGGRRRRDDRHRGRPLGRVSGCTCSRASRCSTTTCLMLAQFRWEGPDSRSRRASTRSCSTSPTTAPASPRAARGVLKVDGQEVATLEDSEDRSRSCCRSTRPSTSASTPARR